MRPDNEDMNLVITNGYNGKTEVFTDFFKYSNQVQEVILGDIIVPMLYEFKSVHISVGYKNT